MASKLSKVEVEQRLKRFERMYGKRTGFKIKPELKKKLQKSRYREFMDNIPGNIKIF